MRGKKRNYVRCRHDLVSYYRKVYAPGKKPRYWLLEAFFPSWQHLSPVYVCVKCKKVFKPSIVSSK